MRRDARDAEHEGQWLSPPLRDALAETLAAGEQAMLFLNRRGYAPLTLCEACGHKMTCPHCSAWLVEHRYRKRLACHQCGYEIADADRNARNATRRGTLIACGPGVERVAEEFAAFFPKARYCHRLVRHHARPAGNAGRDPRHGQARDRCADRHPDRRQGPSFSAAHSGRRDRRRSRRRDGDVRARERTFQLLHQVSGRAGRAEKPGLVLIQTRNPEDAVMQALARGDRDGFYEQERGISRAQPSAALRRLAALIICPAMTARRCARSRAQLGKAAPPRKRRESVGTDTGLLCPAARPDARAACWCRRRAAWMCRPICAPGWRR